MICSSSAQLHRVAEPQRLVSPRTVAAAQTQSGAGSPDSGRLPTEQWQGQEVAFMRSNEHSKDRRGSWHPEGLEGAALHLVQGDEKNGR